MMMLIVAATAAAVVVVVIGEMGYGHCRRYEQGRVGRRDLSHPRCATERFLGGTLSGGRVIFHLSGGIPAICPYRYISTSPLNNLIKHSLTHLTTLTF